MIKLKKKTIQQAWRALGIGVLTTSFSLAACAVDSAQEASRDAYQENQSSLRWSHRDRPTAFDAQLEYRLAELPGRGEAKNIPWAGNYWPTYQDSINHKWAGASSLSPAAKFGAAFGIADMEDQVSAYRGIDSMDGRKTCSTSSECDRSTGETCAKRDGQETGRCVPTWFGICHAWAPAAILEPEPVNPVTVNGVTFQVQDIKALMSLAYDRNTSRGVSLRCNRTDSRGEIEYDAYGRPLDRFDECRDTNPGTFHILLTNFLGLRNQAFVEDRTFDSEVWNQPVRGYEVTRQERVSAEQANQLVGAEGGTYLFNPDATDFYHVEVKTHYITESSANQDGHLGDHIDRYTRTDHYAYVLELDARGEIIGGEWLGQSKRNHPDFLWLPIRPATSVMGGTLEYAKVKSLLEASVAGQPTETQVVLSESGSVSQGGFQDFVVEVEPGDRLVIRSESTRDIDLYAAMDREPTLESYDWVSGGETGQERIALTAGQKGRLFIRIHGYEAGDFKLEVERARVAQPEVLADLDDDVALHAMKRFSFPVKAGESFEISTKAPADIDVYAAMDREPTLENYDWVSGGETGQEQVRLTAPSDGVLQVAVHGYEASRFSLKVVRLPR